ncbi:MAG: hypothetical protein R3C97_10040 [Geminicoccaceae bacterium]
MPKKIAELVQSPKDKAVIVELAADEVAMVTGMMGGCVSVIVLTNPQNDKFQTVRGHHGSGGVRNVNWDELLNGAKLGANDLVVFGYSPDEHEEEVKRIQAAAKAVGQAKGTRHVFAAYSNVYVDRKSPHPTVREFKSAEEAGFEVRKGRWII